MIETEHLIIRNASFADLDRFAEWESREEVIQNFCVDFKRDLDTLTSHFHDITKDASRKWLSILYKPNNLIGRIGITNIDPLRDSMDINILYISDTSLRGQGLGYEVMRGILEHAFTELGLHRVSIDHFLDDAVTERLCDQIGFRKEGLMIKAGKKDNQYYDLQLRSILREEWEEQKEILAETDPQKIPKVVSKVLTV